MEPYQTIPSDSPDDPLISDEMAAANNDRPHLATELLDLYYSRQPHQYSPTEDTLWSQGISSLPQDSWYFDHIVPSDARSHHPMTPPKQDGEEQHSSQWNAQQNAQRAHMQHQSPFPPVQPLGHATQPAHSSYRSPSSIPPMLRMNYAPPWPPLEYHAPASMLHQPYIPGHVQNQQLPPYPTSGQQRRYGLEAQYGLTQSHNAVPCASDQRIRPHEQNARHGFLPIGSFQLPPTSLAYSSAPSQTPRMYQYPESNLHQQDPSFVTPTRQRTRPIHTAPSPGQDGITPPDKKTREKMEAYRQKGKKARHQRRATAFTKATSPTQRYPPKSTTLAGKKQKPANRLGDVSASTVAPSLRPTHVSRDHFAQPHNAFSANDGRSLYTAPYQHDDSMNMDIDYANESELPLGTLTDHPRIKVGPDLVEPEKPAIDPDEQPQKIFDYYRYYNWSITLYEVDSNSQYDFAQSWLEDLFASNLPPGKYQWESHTTAGFIKDGGRLSFLAMHNAANPFGKHLADSTTSIGVYGYYWYNHEDIHWKTFAPSIRWLLDWCVANKVIAVKQKWRNDMPKVADRRFHKAYWLAANRKHLSNLLKRNEDMVDKPHDMSEQDYEDGFMIDESDLTNECGVSVNESEEVWEDVLSDIEMHNDEDMSWSEHVVTGRSEGW